MEKTLHSEGHLRLIALLRQQRLAAKLSQVELAQRLGRTQGFVATYESGQRRIDVVEFAAICDALGVKASTLLRRWER
ncbi:MAG: helix-turn-helix transcriptional regulator [Acidimicrobiales bacterium]|nr:helix-turn-helix transcriptional regulator [Acidimicrobiales bacterium]